MTAAEPARRLTATAGLAERFLLPLVLAVAAAGVAWPGPGRVAAAHNGIDAALAVLVFATGLSLRLAAWPRYAPPGGASPWRWPSAPRRCPSWPGQPAN